MNTSYYNHTGYGPLPFWDDLTNYTTFNNRDFVQPLRGDDGEEKPLPPSTLGLATGALFILTCGSKKAPLKLEWILWTVVLLSALVLLLPVLCTLLLYKLMANLCLRGRILEGGDAVWALDADEAASLAVINVLAVLSGDLTIEHLRQVVRERLVPSHAKLKNLRQSSLLGFFFWKKQQSFHLDDYVKVLDCSDCASEVATDEELRRMISKLSNAQLPHGHLAGWEIYLGPKLLRQGEIHRAVIFRVHHTLGDGPSLFRALLSSLAVEGDQSAIAPDPDVIKRLISRLRSRNNRESFMDNVVNVGSSLKEQVFLSSDQNSLHGPNLSGRKEMAWVSSSHLMQAAKSIHTLTGASFSAGLLASFLAAVAKYGAYSDALRSCSIVLPARIPTTKIKPAEEMSNAFAMTLVMSKLPGAEMDAASQVRAAERALQHATKPAVLVSNGLIIRLVGELCPRPLASAALRSRQCTAALSNMPGPDRKISLFGAQLQKLAFWVPHRGSTGVGASVLSYAGDLSLGINIDCALLDGTRGAQDLVDLWEEQLLRMADELSRTSSPDISKS